MSSQEEIRPLNIKGAVAVSDRPFKRFVALFHRQPMTTTERERVTAIIKSLGDGKMTNLDLRNILARHGTFITSTGDGPRILFATEPGEAKKIQNRINQMRRENAEKSTRIVELEQALQSSVGRKKKMPSIPEMKPSDYALVRRLNKGHHNILRGSTDDLVDELAVMTVARVKLNLKPRTALQKDAYFRRGKTLGADTGPYRPWREPPKRFKTGKRNHRASELLATAMRGGVEINPGPTVWDLNMDYVHYMLYAVAVGALVYRIGVLQCLAVVLTPVAAFLVASVLIPAIIMIFMTWAFVYVPTMALLSAACSHVYRPAWELAVWAWRDGRMTVHEYDISISLTSILCDILHELVVKGLCKSIARLGRTRKVHRKVVEKLEKVRHKIEDQAVSPRMKFPSWRVSALLMVVVALTLSNMTARTAELKRARLLREGIEPNPGPPKTRKERKSRAPGAAQAATEQTVVAVAALQVAEDRIKEEVEKKDAKKDPLDKIQPHLKVSSRGEIEMYTWVSKLEQPLELLDKEILNPAERATLSMGNTLSLGSSALMFSGAGLVGTVVRDTANLCTTVCHDVETAWGGGFDFCSLSRAPVAVFSTLGQAMATIALTLAEGVGGTFTSERFNMMPGSRSINHISERNKGFDIHHVAVETAHEVEPCVDERAPTRMAEDPTYVRQWARAVHTITSVGPSGEIVRRVDSISVFDIRTARDVWRSSGNAIRATVNVNRAAFNQVKGALHREYKDASATNATTYYLARACSEFSNAFHANSALLNAPPTQTTAGCLKATNAVTTN